MWLIQESCKAIFTQLYPEMLAQNKVGGACIAVS